MIKQEEISRYEDILEELSYKLDQIYDILHSCGVWSVKELERTVEHLEKDLQSAKDLRDGVL